MKKATDAQLRALADQIDRCAWKIDDLREKIAESGHPQAEAFIAALDANCVQIFASVASIVEDVLAREGGSE